MQKIFFNFFILANLFVSIELFSSSLQDYPKPYSEIEELLPFNNHGWYANGEWIGKIMLSNKISTAIEVGSWLGCSTRHIASLLQPDGKLYAVDTWKGSVEHYQNEEWTAMLPSLFQQFLSNIIHSGLTDVVVPVKKTSLEAAKELSKKFENVDLVYIDASHDTYSVILDLHAYWYFISQNDGILCGADWWWDSVKLAVRIFAQYHNLTIYASENFWFLKKEGAYAEKDFKNENIDIWKFGRLQ